MTAEIEHIILEQLRRIRGTVDATREDVIDLKLRMSAVEMHLGQVHAQLAGLNSRMDRLDERLTRVERRQDIVGPEPAGTVRRHVVGRGANRRAGDER